MAFMNKYIAIQMIFPIEYTVKTREQEPSS